MIDPNEVFLAIEAELWYAFLYRCPEWHGVINERPPPIVLPNVHDLKIRA